jgi:hypothetical protein
MGAVSKDIWLESLNIKGFRPFREMSLLAPIIKRQITM